MEDFDTEISVVDAEKLINEGRQLVDVRTPEEWEQAHLELAISIPMDQVADQTSKIAPDAIIMCKSGARSAQVVQYLNQFGNQTRNLSGGIVAWIDAGKSYV